MRLKTTLVLLVVVAALFLVWRFMGPVREEVVTTQTLLGAFPTDAISRVEVVLGTGEQTMFERKGGTWWIVEPFSDRADTDALARLLQVLASNPREASDSSPSNSLLAELKLEPPRARVTLIAGDKTYRLRVGDRDPTSQFVWVKLEGDDTLYRTGANLANVLDLPRQDWRDRRFLAGDAALVRSVTLARPGEPPVSLVHDGADWRMTSPVDVLADGTTAGKLSSGILLLTVRRFLLTNPDPNSLAKKGLDATATVLTFDFGSRKLEVRFGAADGAAVDAARCAIDSERGHMFEVEGPALAALRFPSKRFRDPDIVRATTKNVERIRLRRPARGPDVALEFRPTTRTFDVVEPFARRADDSRSSTLFSWLLDVSALRAIDFPDAAGVPGDRGFMDRSELPPLENGDPLDRFGFDDPDAILELRLRTETGVAKDVTIEFAKPAGDGTVPVRRKDRTPDSAYLVAQSVVDKVLGLDARQLLPTNWFPRDLLHVTRARFEVAGKGDRTIERDPKPPAEYWSGDTPQNDFQSYLTKLTLPDSDAVRVLPRDADPKKDGFATPSARLVLTVRDEPRPTITVVLGKKDASGTVVLATIDSFPDRNVVELPAFVLDELVRLFP